MSIYINISKSNAEEFRAQVRSLIKNPPSWMSPVCYILDIYLDEIPSDMTNIIYTKEY